MWERREASSARKRELSQEKDLCSVISPSLTVKVHGVLKMLALMKPGKKSDAIFDRYMYAFFPPCQPPSFTIVVLSNSSTCTNALQPTDAIPALLHSFVKHDLSCAHIYIQT